ncbi:MAG: hypothetical protein GF398_01405 [Chitinivibrionales bacterium]|nr:hypothetical protein [Chitinivibrionales bacterium]
MDVPTILIRIVGIIFVFGTIRSIINHVTGDIFKIEQNSKAPALAHALQNIEQGMDRISAFALTYSGIGFVILGARKLLDLVYGAVQPAMTSARQSALKKVLPAQAQSQARRTKATAPVEDPSDASVMLNRLFNEALFVLWFAFMLLFSVGMIVNN